MAPLKVIYVSGSILNEKIYNIAHETFSGIAIYNVYGLSEAGPRVTAQRADCCKRNSVGKAIKGVEIVLADDNGTPVPPGKRGIIHVQTPSRYSRYISGNEKFRSLYQNWLNTGDIGFIDENEELHILDRIDNVIIIDSHKIYPNEVQQQIIDNTTITECVVAKMESGEKEFIGCLCTSQVEGLNLIKKLRKILPPYEISHYYLKCENIPRTANGKVSIKESTLILSKAYSLLKIAT